MSFRGDRTGRPGYWRRSNPYEQPKLDSNSTPRTANLKIITAQNLLREFDDVLSSVEGGESYEIRGEDGRSVALLLPIEEEPRHPTLPPRRAANRRLFTDIESLADQMKQDILRDLGT